MQTWTIKTTEPATLKRTKTQRTKPPVERHKLSAHPEHGTMKVKWTTVVPDNQIAPPTPSVERRIRDCLAAGWGLLAKPLSRGLVRTGLSEQAAIAAVTEALKLGLLVPRRGGGLCSFADRAHAAW